MKKLTHIHADHCASVISLLEFKQFCHEVWSGEKHNFVSIANGAKQASEEIRKELAPMRKTLTNIDGGLVQRTEASSKPPLDQIVDVIFGIYTRQDGQLVMGYKIVQIDRKTLKVDGTEYQLKPGLRPLISRKYPRPGQWNSNDYLGNKELVAQTKVKSYPNRAGTAQPHATWKWNHMLKKMVIPVNKSAEEEGSEDTEDTDTDCVKSYPDSVK